jgi:hypothetical protein
MDRMGRPSPLCGSKLMVMTHLQYRDKYPPIPPLIGNWAASGSESCHADSDGQRLSWADHWLSIAVAQEFWTGRCGAATFLLRPQ